ncbi:lamin tail domain-containing protein [Halobacterium sp. KA-6]|uniref:lamin tail domain-containing protein n=1 Tax=Halobacterium sp. KA-6 TaxID=2896368 RepID=UPI001E3322BA|nr:lamin tail domain-containing protein [Halobacterium sp. KA-6]MCD2202844.1 lamin tail domain-containing protein [Halobacterium sp. KA-6]
MTDGSDTVSDSDSTRGLSRRGFTAGAVGLGALALGGAGVYQTLQNDGDDQRTFLLRQGKLRWTVTALSHGDDTVEEFYDYQSEGTSANPATDLLADDEVARTFVYDGPVGSSLAFLHGSPDVPHGGTARFSFSGLSRDSGEWAVRDDPVNVDDDFEPWEGGNSVVEWQWGAGKTDGGAFWGGLDREDFTISVTPKTLNGVDAWRFLAGDPADPRRIDLAEDRPAQLKPAKGRQVKRANVEIMPGEDPNEFDPYVEDRITVAIRSPPETADGDWVDPADVDPGNYSVNFGSRSYLAGGNGAQPQSYAREDGALHLEYTTRAAQFDLSAAHGFVVGKVSDSVWFRGKDTVQPGGFDNSAASEATLVVSDLDVAPDGDAFADEFVAFTNDGDAPLDMSGYVVSDESGREFRVPDGFTLDAGQEVRLHTGDGERTDTDLYWGASQPVWNDDGDTILVRDADGNTVLEYAYPRQ